MRGRTAGAREYTDLWLHVLLCCRPSMSKSRPPPVYASLPILASTGRVSSSEPLVATLAETRLHVVLMYNHVYTDIDVPNR